MENDVMTHITLGAAIAYGIQLLKHSRLPWISNQTVVLNRVVSVLSAVIVGLGITVTGDGDHGWTAHIPMVSVLLQGSWESVKQFLVNQLLYDGAIRSAWKGGSTV